MDRYAVFGKPVSHSLSPNIHTQFAQQTHQQMIYEAITIDAGKLKAGLDDFFSHEGRGANITVPYKTEAFELATQHSMRALRAKAVNTLLLNNDGTWFGDNTDGIGFIRDLCEYHGHTLKSKKILLLGAGGAVRGILPMIMDSQPSEVFIANRTRETASALAAEMSSQTSLAGGGFEELAGESFDVIINGTSASLGGEVPSLPATVYQRSPICYDLMYGERARLFLDYSIKQGASHVYSGLGMLIEQAAESFLIWRGVRPKTDEIRLMLKARE